MGGRSGPQRRRLLRLLQLLLQLLLWLLLLGRLDHDGFNDGVKPLTGSRRSQL